jgi:hypothetical protein
MVSTKYGEPKNAPDPRTLPMVRGARPVREIAEYVVYLVRMGNRAHVAKILELHYLDLWQCGRKQPCHPLCWPEVLAFEWMQTTPEPVPASRKKGLG